MAEAPHPYSTQALAASLVTATQPNHRANAEAWLAELNIPMVDVSFLCADGKWSTEKHVDDPTTIFETIAMSLGKGGSRYAVVAYQGRWALVGPSSGKIRYFDNREAAEMVALHNG